MSEGTQNIGDEQAVVGEPASHPHQAVVVGEPPEAVDPVLGEPAFANGLQDQQPTLPLSAEETSANGVQSVSHTPPSSHVSTHAGEESPNLQQVPAAEARDSDIGETDTHQLEPPVAENPGLSGAAVDEASGASDAPAAGSTAAGTPARSPEEEAADDFPDDVEVTHIVDSPSQATPSLDEAPSENPYAALEEEEEDSEAAPGENPTSNSAFTEGAPASNTSSAPDEISAKGSGDQQEELSFLSAAQDKPQTEDSHSIQTDTEDGSLEGTKAAYENVSTGEAEQEGQVDVVGQKLDSKEANLEKEDTYSFGSPPHELDEGSERATEDTPPEAESTATAANGNNSYHHGEDGVLEREQDLPKVEDDASSEAEKSGFRSKLPLIFTGLAIAAVGVVVASISRPR